MSDRMDDDIDRLCLAIEREIATGRGQADKIMDLVKELEGRLPALGCELLDERCTERRHRARYAIDAGKQAASELRR